MTKNGTELKEEPLSPVTEKVESGNFWTAWPELSVVELLSSLTQPSRHKSNLRKNDIPRLILWFEAEVTFLLSAEGSFGTEKCKRLLTVKFPKRSDSSGWAA